MCVCLPLCAWVNALHQEASELAPPQVADVKPVEAVKDGRPPTLSEDLVTRGPVQGMLCATENIVHWSGIEFLFMREQQ